MADSTQGARLSPADPKTVFDAALAQYPTRTPEAPRIGDMPHVTNAPAVVEGYRAAMKSGDRFPPISLVRLFGIWFVADGHKRLTAFRALGEDRVLVEVWP